MSANVDYDYDAVIDKCKTSQSWIDDLASGLNSLSGGLVDAEDSFHSREGDNAISEIYNGFSSIIGTGAEKTGLKELMNDIANLINTINNEAETDKNILEAGMDALGSAVTSIGNTMSSTISNTAVNLAKYANSVLPKRNISSEAASTLGVVTTGNQTYSIVPDNEYVAGTQGQISQSDFELLVAQAAGESGNSYDDMLGVTTTVLNRLEASGNFGNSVSEVFEKGYFPWGRSYKAYVPGGKYYNTDWGQEKLAQVREVVSDALSGTRNLGSNVYYYAGDGKFNHFSDNC